MKVRRRRRAQSGFTLIELLVAAAVLAMVAMLIFGAFSQMRQSKDGIQRVGDRYHEGRQALRRIARELASAYVSSHKPINEALAVQETAFIGSRGTPADRVDFNSFAHTRLDRNSHQSDQMEVSYFGMQDPKDRSINDLVRRTSPRLDLEPDSGGRIDVLATDIDLFDLEYLDPLTGKWTDTWDTTQAIGEAGRLPIQVRVVLVLNGGRRRGKARGQETIRLMTKVAIPINKTLSFAIR